MLIGLINNKQIYAENLSKKDRGKNYICPRCKEKIILKYGDIKIPHFAHYSNPCDINEEPESKLHLNMKKYVYNYFKNKFKSVELEKWLNDQRADVYIITDTGKQIAIECQCSNITKENILKRTEKYTEKGIYTLWLFPTDYFIFSKIIKYPLMYKVIKDFYYGRIYTCYREEPTRHDGNEFNAFFINNYWEDRWSEWFQCHTVYKYKTKAKILYRKILDDWDLNLLLIEKDGYKLARFKDKYYTTVN